MYSIVEMYGLHIHVLPYNWKYLDLGVVPCIVLHHHKHCARIYQGALLSSRLRYLNNTVSLQIYKKYNWQCASVELTLCTAYMEGHWLGPRVLLHALHHYALWVEIIFNLAVSIPTTKLPNLIPHQIFWLYCYSIIPQTAVEHACAIKSCLLKGDDINKNEWLTVS